MNKETINILIWVAAIAIPFLFLWRKGYLLRLRNYILETREELRKCTWPTWAELRGSTFVVMTTVLLLGVFTVGIDFIIAMLIRWMTLV